MRLIDVDALDLEREVEMADDWKTAHEIANVVKYAPTVDAVPLDKLCKLLAEMYHCPCSGWPSSGHACHPDCPDEAFEKLCGTDCEKYSDAERWKAFLTKWMDGLYAADKR